MRASKAALNITSSIECTNINKMPLGRIRRAFAKLPYWAIYASTLRSYLRYFGKYSTAAAKSCSSASLRLASIASLFVSFSVEVRNVIAAPSKSPLSMLMPILKLFCLDPNLCMPK
ncbi:MAG: hypothetical protein QXV17_02070 [Candidatus Micrarchaeaceae archaeon]